MPYVKDRVTGKTELVATQKLQETLASDPERYTLASDVNVVDPTTGHEYTQSRDEFMKDFESKQLTSSAGDLRETQYKRNARTYGDGFLNEAIGAAEGVARGATAGYSDVFARAIHGDDYADAMKQRAEHTALAKPAEVLGIVGPVLLSGGGYGAARGAAAVAKGGATVAKSAKAGSLFARVAKGTASLSPTALSARTGLAVGTKLGRGSRVAAMAIEGGIDAALYQANSNISELMLEDEPMTVEAILAGVDSSALFGLAAGGAIGGVISGGEKGLAAMRKYKTTKIAEREAKAAAKLADGEAAIKAPIGEAEEAAEAMFGRVGEAYKSRIVQIEKSIDEVQAVKPTRHPRGKRDIDNTREALRELVGEELDFSIASMVKRTPEEAIRVAKRLDDYYAAILQFDGFHGTKFADSFMDTKKLYLNLDDPIKFRLLKMEGKGLKEYDPKMFEAYGDQLTDISKPSGELLNTYAVARQIGRETVEEGVKTSKFLEKTAAQRAALEAKEVAKKGNLSPQAEAAFNGASGLAYMILPPGVNFMGAQAINLMKNIAKRGGGPSTGKIMAQTAGVRRTIAQSVAKTAKVLTKSPAGYVKAASVYSESDTRSAMEAIQKRMENPQEFKQTIRKNLESVTQLNTKLGMELSDAMFAKARYLNAQIPLLAGLNGQYADAKAQPSTAEVRRFANVLRAAQDPLTIIQDLESNRVTQEAIDTVRVLYPEIYSDIQIQLTVQLGELQATLPYERRIQLSRFGVSVEPSFQPEHRAALQGRYQKRREEQEKQGQQQGSSAAPKGAPPTEAQRIGN